MWEILHSMADWDCSRIAILQEILKTQNRPGENSVYLRESNVFLIDIINLDPKIHIKYVDTKNQLDDILTKGSSTRTIFSICSTL